MFLASFSFLSRARRLAFAASAALVLLTACGGGGRVGSDASEITVSYSASMAGVEIPADCSGAACEVTGSTTYRNGAALVWSYRNSSDQPVQLDITFGNLARDQEISYVFSNGYSEEVDTAPDTGRAVGVSSGVLPSTLGASTQAETVFSQTVQLRHDDWHAQQGSSQADFYQSLKGKGAIASAQLGSEPAAAVFASATVSAGSPTVAVVGDDREWFNSEAKSKVVLQVQSDCTDGGLRRILVWAAGASAGESSSSEYLTAFRKVLCGTTGAVARLKTLLGNVWGPHQRSGFYLNETASKPLDLNVLLVSGGTAAGWAGYFYPIDSCTLPVACAESNKALVLYINADLLKTNLPFALSMVIHELTHMVDWYERSVRLGLPPHDTWLEEMKAMMSEDILTRALVRDDSYLPYNPIITNRLKNYLNTGGGLTLLDWPVNSKASGHYGMAGGFGAYLNRQYGLGIYKDLNSQCSSSEGSWECLDGLIRKYGGVSLAESFNQYGAAVFSLSSGEGPSRKFNFIARKEDGYTLDAVDLRGYKTYRPSRAKDLKVWLGTVQTYMVEKLNLGIFLFTRRSIVVPPKTHLTVTVQ